MNRFRLLACCGAATGMLALGGCVGVPTYGDGYGGYGAGGGYGYTDGYGYDAPVYGNPYYVNPGPTYIAPSVGIGVEGGRRYRDRDYWRDGRRYGGYRGGLPGGVPPQVGLLPGRPDVRPPRGPRGPTPNDGRAPGVYKSPRTGLYTSPNGAPAQSHELPIGDRP